MGKNTYVIELLNFMLKNKKALLPKEEMKTKSGKKVKRQKEGEIAQLESAIEKLSGT